VGVAKCTASRIPSMEFPDMTKARREPACGARKTAPVWGEEKAHSPVNRRKKEKRNGYSKCFIFFRFGCLFVSRSVCLGSFSKKGLRLRVVKPKPKLF